MMTLGSGSRWQHRKSSSSYPSKESTAAFRTVSSGKQNKTKQNKKLKAGRAAPFISSKPKGNGIEAGRRG